MEAHFYDSNLQTSQKAIEINTKWNSQGMLDKLVVVNLPEV
jgi:hypothetical protein